MESSSGNCPADKDTYYRYVSDNEIVWNYKGQTVIRLTKNDDGRGLVLEVENCFLPEIEDWMKEGNKIGVF
jgi:hypothetical protein